MATATTADYKSLLQRQIRVKKELWREFYDGAYLQQDLRVFGLMKNRSIDTQLVHSVAKFASLGGSNELFGTEIGFLGNRDDWGNQLFPVKLPAENACKWGQFTCTLNPLDISAFYEVGTMNQEKKLDPTMGTWALTIMKVLPRMIFLPLTLGKYVTIG